jgi:ATP-dependent DNA helicase RecQ
VPIIAAARRPPALAPAAGPGLAAARRRLPATGRRTGPDPLLAALQDWRRGLARAAGVRPDVIVPDRTLEAVAAARPATRGALRGLPGVGPLRLERHGSAVLALVRAHG